MLEKIPVGRMGEINEVAAAVFFYLLKNHHILLDKF